MPGRSRISWTPSQRKRLADAVRAFNGTITRLERSGRYDILPNRVNVADEMRLINTRDQLRTRVGQLRRILKGVRPDSQDVVTLSDGSTTPRWMRDEVRRSYRMVTRRRDELRSEIYPEWDKMTRAQQARALADKNIAPLDVEESYYTPQGLDDLTRERYMNDYVYMDQYLDVWGQWHAANPGYNEVVRIIRRLVSDYPGLLHRILEEDHDEASIEYLYPEFGSRRISAYREPFKQRSNNVVRFWTRQWERASKERIDYESKGWIEEELVADLGYEI